MAQLQIPILVDWDDIKDHMAKSDIVEVVRCKDCKFFSRFQEHNGLCEISGLLEDNNFFCRDGEKRENDE